jgi:hypothetical protein
MTLGMGWIGMNYGCGLRKPIGHIKLPASCVFPDWHNADVRPGAAPRCHNHVRSVRYQSRESIGAAAFGGMPA